VVAALGRHADGELTESALVTLWDAETLKEVTSIEVGPASPIEEHYAFQPLPERVTLQAGREYRLSQLCRAKMQDRWFDGYASVDEVAALCANRYARFIGGCCRNEHGFPNRLDGDRRRAGMVNLKFAREGLSVQSVTREELAHTLARVAAEEEPASPEAVDAYLRVLARLLALLVDEMATSPEGVRQPPAPAMAVVAPEADLSGRVRMEQLEADAASAEGRNTVFNKRFAAEVADFGRRYVGSLDEYGAPLEGAFVVGSTGGEVLAARARLLPSATAAASEGHLSAADVAALLPRGMAFARSSAGDVTAFLAAEVRQGRALRIEASSAAAAADPNGRGSGSNGGAAASMR